MMDMSSIILYLITHIIPLIFTIAFIGMFKSDTVHYATLCRVMNIVYISYLIVLVSVIAYLSWAGISFCCDSNLTFFKGLWEVSKVEPTLKTFYDFIWESGPTYAWPDGYKSSFRSICVIAGYISFILMFIAILSYHGWVMFLTIVVYSVIFVVAFHFPFILGFFIMWMFCLYYQSQALRKKYWESNNITPPDMGGYFGDHFY